MRLTLLARTLSPKRRAAYKPQLSWMSPVFNSLNILFPVKICPHFALSLFFRLWTESTGAVAGQPTGVFIGVEVFYFYFHHITTCSVTVAVVLIGGSGFTFLTFFISERK